MTDGQTDAMSQKQLIGPSGPDELTGASMTQSSSVGQGVRQSPKLLKFPPPKKNIQNVEILREEEL